MIVSAWNPCQLNEMIFPPCHVKCFSYPYVTEGNKFQSQTYQKIDIICGLTI